MASLLSILLLLLAFSSSFLSCFADSSRKELKDKGRKEETSIQLGQFVESYRIDPSRVVQLSWQPRVFLYEGFLSGGECDHLISLGHGVKTTLGSHNNSEHVVSNQNLTSSDIPLLPEDDVVSRIEERISAWTFLPKENSRPFQILHYGDEEVGQSYDYFGNRSTVESTTPLMAVVVLYLSNVTRGGQVLFPKSERGGSWSDCSSSDILRPVKGNAILFFTLHPSTSPDKSSSHVRCPVLEGEMWYANKFFHTRPVRGENVSSESDGTECTDEDVSCSSWATLGECQRNPVFMIGSPDYYGTCRRSCNAC